MSLSELVERIRRNDDVGKMITITFDDGFENVLDVAVPIMRKYGAKGCTYIVTRVADEGGLIWTDAVEVSVRNAPDGVYNIRIGSNDEMYTLSDQKSRFAAMAEIKKSFRKLPNADRVQSLTSLLDSVKTETSAFRIATWDRFRKVDRDVLEIGAHTRTHPNLTTIDDYDELREEICGSFDDVCSELVTHSIHFCYPAGDYDSRTIELIKECGFESATTTNQSLIDTGSDVFQLPRVSTDTNLDLFASCVSGSYYAIIGTVTRSIRKTLSIVRK